MQQPITLLNKQHWAISLLLLFTFGCTPISRDEQSVSENAVVQNDMKAAQLSPVAEAWAQNQINVPIFRNHALVSNAGQQWVSFYDTAGYVVIAERNLDEDFWDLKNTRFTGDLNDAHNSISLGLDGDDFLHMSWDHHNDPLNYVRSLQPTTLAFGDLLSMTGQNESRVTYPEFINLPNGDLLFLYRQGGSGNGNMMLNRYDIDTQEWHIVQHGWLDGQGERNAYTNKLVVDSKGRWHLSWVWRETPDVASNHDLCYAMTDDEGKTWKRSDGSVYELPITADNAEYIYRIPQNSGLINQTTSTVNRDDHPLIATYWQAEEDEATQYYVVWFDGRSWQSSQVTQRTSPFKLGGKGTRDNPISRPLVLCDDQDRTYVVFNDAERGSRVSVAVTENLEKGDWVIYDLTEESVGNWEPVYDQQRWERDGILNLMVQKVGQGDGETLENMPPTLVHVLEWKPNEFF